MIYFRCIFLLLFFSSGYGLKLDERKIENKNPITFNSLDFNHKKNYDSLGICFCRKMKNNYLFDQLFFHSCNNTKIQWINNLIDIRFYKIFHCSSKTCQLFLWLDIWTENSQLKKNQLKYATKCRKFWKLFLMS